MSESGLKIIKAIVGGVVLLLLVMTVTRWYGDFRISSTNDVLEDAAGSSQGEGGDSAEATPDGGTESSASGDTTEASAQTVVILTDGLNFREEPKKDSKVIRGLDKGEKLTLVEEKDGWYLVRTEQGTEGWITASSSYSRVE